MTSSIPAPSSSTTVNQDSGQASPLTDDFASSLGSPAQGGPSGGGSPATFDSLLNPGSDDAPAPKPAAAAPSQPADESVAVAQPGVRIKDLTAGSPSGAQADDAPTPGGQGPKRDLLESIASLITPLWTPPQQPVPGSAAPQGAAGTGAGAVPVGPFAAGTPAMQGAYGKLVAAIKAGATEVQASGIPTSAGDEIPGQAPVATTGLPAAPGMAAAPAASAVSGQILGAALYTEKIAAGPAGSPAVSSGAISGLKKNFLTSVGQKVKDDGEPDGIGIAKSSPNMLPAYTNSRQMPGFPVAAATGSPAVGPQPGSAVAQAPATPVTPTLAPVLAQRAVETVLNVIDAQQTTAGQGGVVKLDFNFGGEALAVHVQMRGGEVHTEFRTNSPELRSALSSEWRAAAGQRDPEGVRLVEPVFASAEGGTSTANGDASHSSFSSQQQNPQQQSQGPGQSLSLGSTRAFSPSPAEDPSEGSMPSPIMLPTSQHLAAVA